MYLKVRFNRQKTAGYINLSIHYNLSMRKICLLMICASTLTWSADGHGPTATFHVDGQEISCEQFLKDSHQKTKGLLKRLSVLAQTVAPEHQIQMINKDLQNIDHVFSTLEEEKDSKFPPAFITFRDFAAYSGGEGSMNIDDQGSKDYIAKVFDSEVSQEKRKKLCATGGIDYGQYQGKYKDITNDEQEMTWHFVANQYSYLKGLGSFLELYSSDYNSFDFSENPNKKEEYEKIKEEMNNLKLDIDKILYS